MARKQAKVIKAPRKPTRGQDRERVAKARIASLPAGAWADERDGYPEGVRASVDALAVRGASLNDVYLLQASVFFGARDLYRGAIAARRVAIAAAGEGGEYDHTRVPGHSTLLGYEHSMTQSLKHMRAIAETIGPQLTLKDLPVRVPEGFDSASIAAILDGLVPSEILD